MSPIAVALSGCVQLVAFEQPVIGQPDVIEGGPRGDVLCDEDVRLGVRAACDVSCTIEPGEALPDCGGRLADDGDALALDVGGLFEVEITYRACAELDRPATVRSARGSRLVIDGREARLEDPEGARIADQANFLPEDECDDRTALFQDGRLELVEAGQRWCAEALPRFGDGPWRISRPVGALEAVELCLRTPAES